MAIANITNNILTDSGVATSSLLPLTGGTLTGALSGTSATFSLDATINGVKVGKGAGSGTFNTAIGYIALSQNTTGSYNSAFGAYSLSTNSNGIYNAAIGYQALLSNTSGSSNVSVGSLSMHDNTTGQNNTAIGTSSGYYITTGSYNTIVGNYAGTTTLDSNVILADGNGNLRFVGFSTGNVYLGAGTTLPTDSGYKLDVNGTGRFTGALTGTSATFSSGVTFGANNRGFIREPAGDVEIGGTAGAALKLYANGVEYAKIAPSTGFTTTLPFGGTSATFSSSVGIGVAPDFPLTVKTDASANSIKIIGRSGGDSLLSFYASNGTTPYLDFSAGATYVNYNAVNSQNYNWYCNSSLKMVLTSGGNVLIGTSTDNGSKLQIAVASAAVDGTKGVRITNPAGTIVMLECGSVSDSFVGTTSGSDFHIRTNNVNRLSITSAGAATFSSSVTATSFFESSDSRLKTLIQDNYQTKGIASITPKLYTKNGKVELGYYAQDFVGVLDSAVSKGSDDMLSLSYREVLVAKVYALEQRIKELENK
jgi:hypothetical protein